MNRIFSFVLRFLLLIVSISIFPYDFLAKNNLQINNERIEISQLETEIHKQDFIISIVVFLFFLLVALWVLGKKNRKLRKMATFAENDPNVVLELDLDFKLKYCNEAAMKHENLVELMHERHPSRKKFEYLLNKTIKNKKQVNTYLMNRLY
tara:strand:- start:425 stop:877 length:453 start_codon:yes stop_codon:yes gene_type:complete